MIGPFETPVSVLPETIRSGETRLQQLMRCSITMHVHQDYEYSYVPAFTICGPSSTRETLNNAEPRSMLARDDRSNSRIDRDSSGPPDSTLHVHIINCRVIIFCFMDSEIPNGQWNGFDAFTHCSTSDQGVEMTMNPRTHFATYTKLCLSLFGLLSTWSKSISYRLLRSIAMPGGHDSTESLKLSDAEDR